MHAGTVFTLAGTLVTYLSQKAGVNAKHGQYSFLISILVTGQTCFIGMGQLRTPRTTVGTQMLRASPGVILWTEKGVGRPVMYRSAPVRLSLQCFIYSVADGKIMLR